MEKELVRFCAPTLAAVKSAGAFGYPYMDEHALERKIHSLNHRLSNKGIVVLPLRVHEGRALMYVFRPSMLSLDLSHEVARGVLSAYKYPSKNLAFSLLHLARRLEGERFPHELGLFLGYPPIDVLGFILNEGTHYKRAGLWKVYGNEREAERRFRLYRECTERLVRRYLNGERIEDIAVFS